MKWEIGTLQQTLEVLKHWNSTMGIHFYGSYLNEEPKLFGKDALNKVFTEKKAEFHFFRKWFEGNLLPRLHRKNATRFARVHQ